MANPPLPCLPAYRLLVQLQHISSNMGRGNGLVVIATQIIIHGGSKAQPHRFLSRLLRIPHCTILYTDLLVKIGRPFAEGPIIHVNTPPPNVGWRANIETSFFKTLSLFISIRDFEDFFTVGFRVGSPGWGSGVSIVLSVLLGDVAAGDLVSDGFVVCDS